MTIPARLDVRHLRNHALKGIAARRLSVSAGSCLLGIARDGDGAVIIHVNSGGNTCAVEQRLNAAGYRAEALPFDPGVYGGKVRVTLRSEGDRAVVAVIRISIPAPGYPGDDRPVIARYEGRTVWVGHVVKGSGEWIAILWAQPDHRARQCGRVTAGSLRSLRETLRNRVRMEGKWWT